MRNCENHLKEFFIKRRTGYLICRVQCKMKTGAPSFKKSLGMSHLKIIRDF